MLGTKILLMLYIYTTFCPAYHKRKGTKYIPVEHFQLFIWLKIIEELIKILPLQSNLLMRFVFIQWKTLQFHFVFIGWKISFRQWVDTVSLNGMVTLLLLRFSWSFRGFHTHLTISLLPHLPPSTCSTIGEHAPNLSNIIFIKSERTTSWNQTEMGKV